MDDILELLSNASPEYSGGFTNHAPMAAEALWHLGKRETALTWAKEYATRLPVHRPSALSFSEPDWQEYLGRKNFYDAWIAIVQADIDAFGWITALKKWLPRLMPGWVSAAAHGVLRTAHAVRSLEATDSTLRRRELASGIAYWASTFQTLPVADRPGPRGKASQSITRIKLYPLEKRRNHEMLSDGLRLLDAQSGFADAINLIDTSGDFENNLVDLIETFTRAYLTNASSDLFAAIHEVTGAAALQILSAYLDEAARSQALRYAWQSSCALHVMFGTESPAADPPNIEMKPDELLQLAIASGDEHAIKFTEVCLRKSLASKANLFHFAAQDVSGRFLKLKV
ncbi:unnamed protein product [Sphagnum jensenii]